jgi:hypothetical protein
MTGITDLQTLLQNISPELDPTDYIFCCFPHTNYGAMAELNPIASFIEAEGLTLVVPKSTADTHHIPYEGVFKRITLTVHSSLEAVGLTAAFAGKLAEHHISANVMAGYYHDHIFVPTSHATTAINALRELKSHN